MDGWRSITDARIPMNTDVIVSDGDYVAMARLAVRSEAFGDEWEPTCVGGWEYSFKGIDMGNIRWWMYPPELPGKDIAC